MGAAELRDRIVAVFVQDLCVQLVGACCPDAAAVDGPMTRRQESGRAASEPPAWTSPRNSSRNSRRSDFAERE